MNFFLIGTCFCKVEGQTQFYHLTKLFVNHPIYRVTSVKQAGPYCLTVGFNDGVVRAIDFKDILYGELFGPRQDPVEFSNVYIDPEVHALTWPCGADFDPATLHDWPQHEAAFREQAVQWRLMGV